MDEKPEKNTLPEQLQTEMLKFFLKTSIPRMKKEREQEEQAPIEKE